VRLLDLFAGAGGCSVGYARAGFEVVGVDKDPHPDYPFELIVDDAMNWVTDPGRLNQFDAVHASPPCPRFSAATPHDRRQDHPDLLTPTLESFRQWGGTWVIENVPGAPLPGAVTYCGKAMGLPHLKRHRLFASSVFLVSPGCACDGSPTCQSRSRQPTTLSYDNEEGLAMCGRCPERVPCSRLPLDRDSIIFGGVAYGSPHKGGRARVLATAEGVAA
jgi:hypothetical protein